jgi:hypothetical protein
VYSLESFDPVSAIKYIAATAVANAQSIVAGGFEEVWFPTQIVPPGQSGVDFQVTLPKLYTPSARNADSTPFQIKRVSTIEAILDPSLLESESTTVVPYASSATLPTQLVPAAQIPTVDKLINGVTVPTRPIKFGEEVDIIQLSSAPGLLRLGVFDETDSLDPIMNIGTIFYKLEVKTGVGTPGAVTNTCYLSSDISSQNGALLTQAPTGEAQQYHTTSMAHVYINPGIVPVNGDSKATIVSALEGILGIAPGTKFNILATFRLTAEAKTDRGHFLVNANNNVVAKLYNAANAEIALTPLTATGVEVVVSPLGYLPNVRRTNSNLRQDGTIIDNNTTVTYRFPVSLSAPIVSVAPIGAVNTTTLEGLGRVARIRQNGRCVTALKNLEVFLSNINGIPAQSPIIGAEYVIPTYVPHSIDVSQIVVTMNSKDALENLRGQLAASLTNMVNEALIKSHYLAALEEQVGDIDGYEVIVVTDPRIAVHIWESGDIRTFGDNRKYVITKSNNKFFLDKIYFSFRRKSRTGELHPLDFGSLLYTPSLTYDVQLNRNGHTAVQIHTVPIANAYATLPILGVLHVSGLETMYVSE